MACATDHHVESPAEAVANECVEAVEEESSMIPYLPSGIMTDILLRLPAECIFQLWQRNDLLCHLTRTPYFKRAHLDRATPDIVVQSHKKKYDSNIKLFLFDGKAEGVATSLDISSFNEYGGGGVSIDLWSSYEGFLIFKSRYFPTPILCILNPVTKEQVVVTSPCNRSYVCGFYFHPRKKEYELIFVRALDDDAQIWEFQILSLRTKNRRSVGSCCYPPSRKRWPALVDGTFYWMVDGTTNKGAYRSLLGVILSFHTENEELGIVEAVMPSSELKPVDRYQKLFELEGDLCLFDLSTSIIWVFNKSTKQWDKKHSMPSPVNKHDWEFHDYFSGVDYIQAKGEFVAYHRWDGKNKPSYVYNLRLGSWKLLEKKGFEDYDCCAAMNYTPSLVSLDVADPVIPL